MLKDLEFTSHLTTFKSPSLKAKAELVEALARYNKAKPRVGPSVEKLTSMLEVLRVVANNGGIIQADLSRLVKDLESFMFCEMKQVSPLIQAKVYETYLGKAYSDTACDSAVRVPFFYLHLMATDLINELTQTNTNMDTEFKASSTQEAKLIGEIHTLQSQLERTKAVVSDFESQLVIQVRKAAVSRQEARST